MAIKTEKQMVVSWLIEQFPKAFFQKPHLVQPLKLGILEDIIDVYERLDSPPCSKKLLREALNYYTVSKAYLSAQKPDAERIDLYGQPNGTVTAEQAIYAQKRYQERYCAERATSK
ncbi:MAG: ProQ/FinO family protein [Gammaproteobacteria bacterium]|jgi:ProP effector|nr:ProQ/FinO family protein [Legionellales bacterium]NDH67890.1 protein convertase [Gammaproteobacteria bacterium]